MLADLSIASLLRYWPDKDLAQGHLFLIDKPLGWTSFNVVGKVRYALQRKLGYRKIKVGHAGTLDPLATGLMLLCVGRATRLAGDLTSQDKRYLATFQLGATTPSHDMETEIDAHYPTEHIDSSCLDRAIAALTGDQMQTPPLFSAKRVDGKRAYEIARRGKSVEIPPVPITIKEFRVLRFESQTLDVEVCCSKGTYIRALARDLGRELGSGAYLSALRRTASGPFLLQDAWTIPQFEEMIPLMRPVQNQSSSS